MGTPSVALVLVSHSRALAEGLAEVAGQMAPDVAVLAVGGTDDGGLGTDFARVLDALEAAAADGRSAVVLTDLGSAVLTAESALEALDPDIADRVRIAHAPLVEGAIEAAVAAQGGGDLDAVHRAARHAGSVFGAHGRTDGAPADETASASAVAGGTSSASAVAGVTSSASVPAGGTRSVSVTHAEGAVGGAGPTQPATAQGTAVLRNRLGLHARPAAALARTAASFASRITVNGVDARSVLALVGLGAVGGSEVVVSASGPDARTAVHAVVAELEEGFGEA